MVRRVFYNYRTYAFAKYCFVASLEIIAFCSYQLMPLFNLSRSSFTKAIKEEKI